ncbi:MMPL family transporter [Actinophytocola oryzae]|uniref:RND superfamily putative drug exporter n=1 Tax=Actinophytocola oryzae TaxID=502181 RepID=A0A4R7VUL3_9PSEU|nr:MMPL family transporter [Actinophytocola oryzae]TDV53663.1 RND superfamily putative drug exporter [Actinophytocola oryzae]
MRRIRWWVPALLVVVWLGLGAVGGPFAGRLADVVTNDNSSFLPEAAEATEVEHLQRQFSDQQILPAVAVAERRSGVTKEDLDFLAGRAKALAQVDGVATGVPIVPKPSDDGRAVQLVVPVLGQGNPVEVIKQVRAELSKGVPDGLTVLLTGPGGVIADLVSAFDGIDGLLLLVAGLVVVVILVAVYRSPLLPLLVLVSAVFALGVAAFVVYQLAKHDVFKLNGQSQGILFILVFGAATDYALLLVSRFREELRDTEDRFRAVRTAWRATIEPIAASAGTVIIGLLCLLFSDLRSNKGLGPVAAIGIASALLASMTFLPAALALVGRAAFWPFVPHHGTEAPEHRGLWGWVAGRVGARPRLIWVVTTVVLLAGVAFVPQLKANGTAQTDLFLTEVDSARGQDILSAHFPGGSGSPTVIVARSSAAERVIDAARIDGVAGVVPTGEKNGLVLLQATLDAPSDSEKAIATVDRLRTAVHDVPGADAKVGGQTAIQLDVQSASRHDRSLIIPIVLVVIFVVLSLLLRALVAPLLLIATVVLSFGATMGVSALVFNHLFGFPGADTAIPLFGFIFLVALGIDYNIFLMTRVREETLTSDTRTGTLRGLAVTGGVITSAGVVLAATFASLSVIPVLFLAQIAFIVAFGVLLDTVVVRSLLVPALTVDIGRRIWWPAKLSRRAPSESGPAPEPSRTASP